MVPADDNVYPYATFSSLLNLGSLIESILDPNRTRCSVGPDLGTNYLEAYCLIAWSSRQYFDNIF